MTTPAPKPPGIPSFFKILVPVAAILVAVTGGLALIKAKFGRPPVSTEADGPSASIAVGAVLPDFTLHEIGLDGKPGRSVPVSTLASKVTLINFWATWCEACMVEMPSLLALRESYRARGFDLAEVNVDQNPQAVLPPVLRKLGMSFPVYHDEDEKLAELFQISAIPFTLLIDRQRRVLMIENGERDWNSSEIRTLVEKWLAG